MPKVLVAAVSSIGIARRHYLHWIVADWAEYVHEADLLRKPISYTLLRCFRVVHGKVDSFL